MSNDQYNPDQIREISNTEVRDSSSFISYSYKNQEPAFSQSNYPLSSEKVEIDLLKEAINKGERLSEIAKKWNLDSTIIRRMLKREGVDYRRIMLERKKNDQEQNFTECLKFAREEGRIPTFEEFIQIGIPQSKVRFYIRQLKDKGFE